MVISKSSWHYKVVRCYNDRCDERVPNDICRYVRQLVGALLLGGVMACLFGGALLAGAISLFFPIAVLINHFFHCFPDWMAYSQNDKVHQLFQTFLFLGTTIWAVGGSSFSYLRVRNWLDNRRYVKREPTVASTWLKSVKDKTCTLLEFE